MVSNTADVVGQNINLAPFLTAEEANEFKALDEKIMYHEMQLDKCGQMIVEECQRIHKNTESIISENLILLNEYYALSEDEYEAAIRAQEKLVNKAYKAAKEEAFDTIDLFAKGFDALLPGILKVLGLPSKVAKGN